jgi:hypothetical protein
MADSRHADVTNRTSASQVERTAPPFTFYDADHRVYRPQFWAGDKRSHPHLRKADGSNVRDECDVAAAMAAYCRKLVGAQLLDPESEVAVRYLGDGAQVIPMPLPPRAPAPTASSVRAARSAVPGWHGMDRMSIEVDQKLIAALTPDFSAAKIGVGPGTPASKAGLRTGDYVLSAGRYGDAVSLGDFDGLCLPAGAEILVRFHRPGRHKAGQVETALLKLRRRPGASQPRWWQLTPRVAPGPAVERNDRSRFEADMAVHPHLKPLGFKILVRLLRHYDGPNGAYPSYATLAGDVGRKRRHVIDQVAHLAWLGIVTVAPKGGLQNRNGGGFTNRFSFHWPADWRVRRASGAK